MTPVSIKPTIKRNTAKRATEWTNVVTTPAIICRRKRVIYSVRSRVVVNKLDTLSEFWVQIYGSQGWCSGESARFPPMWPGFDSRSVPYVGWVLLLVLALQRGFFSGFSCFLPIKTDISKCQFDQDGGSAWKPIDADMASYLNTAILAHVYRRKPFQKNSVDFTYNVTIYFVMTL